MRSPAAPLLTALLLSLLAGCSALPPPGPEDFRVYRGDGSPASLEDVLSALRAVDVGFLGESHDDAVGHALEVRILRAIAAPGLALSLEMFETDTQLPLDEYLAGHIDAERLHRDARAWDNYREAYAPLVDFAREQGLAVIAANAPRRYVNLVGRRGAAALQELSPQALAFLPPLPYPPASEAYRDKFLTLMGATLPAGSHGAAGAEPGSAREDARASGAEPHSEDEQGRLPRQESQPLADAGPPSDPASAFGAGLQRALEAQSLWDASMAWSIARWLNAQDQGRVLHINGSFHSEGRLGIVERLADYRPGTTALVVTLQPSAGYPAFDAERMRGSGDFVIVTAAPRR